MADRVPSEPIATLVQLCNGLKVSQALYVAAELRIADHLATRPMSSGELAEITGTHAPSLRRLMRALTTLGVFSESPPDRLWAHAHRPPVGERTGIVVPPSGPLHDGSAAVALLGRSAR